MELKAVAFEYEILRIVDILHLVQEVHQQAR